MNSSPKTDSWEILLVTEVQLELALLITAFCLLSLSQFFFQQQLVTLSPLTLNSGMTSFQKLSEKSKYYNEITMNYKKRRIISTAFASQLRWCLIQINEISRMPDQVFFSMWTARSS